MSDKAQSQEKNKSDTKQRPASTPASQTEWQALELAPFEIIQRIRHEPGTLTQRDVLHLQRTVGNKTVERLLDQEQTGVQATRQRGRDGTLQVRHVADSTGPNIARYSDPSSAEFWEGTRRDAGTTLGRTLSSDERALAQFETDITSREEGAGGNIAVDVIDWALEIANAAPPVKVGFKVLQRVYTQLSAVRSGSIALAGFTRTIRAAHDAFQREIPNDWSAVNENSPDLFKDLKALKDAETAENRTEQRTRAVTMLREADQNIPAYPIIMRKLIQAWVAGSQDQTVREWTIDLMDPDDFSSGYLRMNVNIVPDMQGRYLRHSFGAISIDDVDNPEGLKQALISAWGEDFFLDELPFPGHINLIMGSTSVIFRKTGRGPSRGLQGWDTQVVNIQPRFEQATIENRRQMYFEHIRPRVQHLRARD